MFFPERIKSIGPGDKVLEIGPGADPHTRSDVLLELRMDSESDYANQFGHDRKLETDKELVYYDGREFPFEDNSFDYVICSHVLEHVPDVEFFLKEIFRVSSKGYFEYPLAYYEYLYDINAHLNILKYDGSVLSYIKKDETPMKYFKDVQHFFYQSLTKGHSDIVNDLLLYFMEGFEWNEPFQVQHVSSIEGLLHSNFEILNKEVQPQVLYQTKELTFQQHLIEIARKIAKKLKILKG